MLVYYVLVLRNRIIYLHGPVRAQTSHSRVAWRYSVDYATPGNRCVWRIHTLAGVAGMED